MSNRTQRYQQPNFSFIKIDIYSSTLRVLLLCISRILHVAFQRSGMSMYAAEA